LGFFIAATAGLANCTKTATPLKSISIGGKLDADPVTTRKKLIRYLGHLTVNVWPEYEHELVLLQEADRLLREAHVRCLALHRNSIAVRSRGP
jgi:hypothetical protein